jgi:predicted ATPase
MFAARLEHQRGSSSRHQKRTRRSKQDDVKKALFFDDETRSMSTAQTSTLTESIVSSIRQHHSNKERRGRDYFSSRRDNQNDHYSSSSSSLHSLQSSHSMRPRHSRSSKSASSSSTCNSSSSFDCLKLQGRDKHIETWDKSIVTNKSRQFVLLSGNSGSGKSRLAHELACPKRNSTASIGEGDDDGGDRDDNNHTTSLWTLGGKFDARHNSPYAVFSLIIEDLFYSLLPQEEEDAYSYKGVVADDTTTVVVGNDHHHHHEREASSSPPRSSMLFSFICSRLRQSLDDEESKLLIEFIPALRDLLNVRSLDFKSDLEEREDARLEMEDVQRFAKIEFRFQRAFRKVMRGLAKSFGNVDSRLVLVLDDLQWADRASLDLIKEILTDSEGSNSTKERAGGLIVVGCYRDDDDDGGDDDENQVKTLVKELQGGGGGSTKGLSSGVLVHELKVDHLLPKEVGSMITNMMAPSCNDDRSQEADIVKNVADRVYQKTTGNPFFTIQYMRALLGVNDGAGRGDERLLLEKMDAFDVSSAVNFDVMDIILSKLQKLPKAVTR